MHRLKNGDNSPHFTMFHHERTVRPQQNGAHGDGHPLGKDLIIPPSP